MNWDEGGYAKCLMARPINVSVLAPSVNAQTATFILSPFPSTVPFSTNTSEC